MHLDSTFYCHKLSVAEANGSRRMDSWLTTIQPRFETLSTPHTRLVVRCPECFCKCIATAFADRSRTQGTFNELKVFQVLPNSRSQARMVHPEVAAVPKLSEENSVVRAH